MRRTLPLFLALATLPGCIGSFKLTNTIYDFNRELSDNIIVQEVVFLAFVVVPVYEIGIFIDAVVLNTLEFLTGSNPIAKGRPGETRVAHLEDGTTVYATTATDGVTLAIHRADGTELVRDIHVDGRRVEIRDGGGAVLATAHKTLGGKLVVDDGDALSEVDAEVIGAAAAKWRRAVAARTAPLAPIEDAG